MRALIWAAMALSIGFVPISWGRTDDVVPAPGSLLPGGKGAWELAWSDEFDGTEEDLDAGWESQNGRSGHILCSRWRENVSVSDGTLKLTNRKESRGGQEWTSGSIWTKERFTYGYFECRYRYAAAEGTNNSFWLMTKGGQPEVGKRFEIDINEGHFPNEVNTNIHNWSDIKVVDGKKTHPSNSSSFSFGVSPSYSIQLEIPVKTKKIRFSSNHPTHFHLGEFQVFSVGDGGYPDILTNGEAASELSNSAADPATKISVSGSHPSRGAKSVSNLVDGDVGNSWISQSEGKKWIEFEFAEDKTVGCVQFANGWKKGGKWQYLISDYKVEYHNGSEWVEMSSFDINSGKVNFARDYHTFGLDWSRKEIVFYLDGKEIRREKNEFCFSPSPVWLSLAIIKWAGPVTDAIDGTKMEVDYVRVYKPKGQEAPNQSNSK